jgi:riboflavin kinase
MEVLKKLALIGAMRKPVKISSLELARQIDSSPQTASRRLQSLERSGAISRNIVADGQWITITKKGEEMLKTEYNYYRQIFSGGTKNIELEGKVVTGLGEGQYYIAKDGYRKQFESRFGFTPFPGTLNISLSHQSASLRRKLDESSGIRLDGFRGKGRTFGGGKCFKAVIDGVDAAVVIPERTHYPMDIIEIVAPVNFRKTLNLKDGDRAKVKVFL